MTVTKKTLVAKDGATTTFNLAGATESVTGNDAMLLYLGNVAETIINPATSDLQTTSNTKLDTLNTSLGSLATSALQTTSNTKLDTINTSLGSLATSALQSTINTSLGTINTTLGSQATAANQSTQITSLSTINTSLGTINTTLGSQATAANQILQHTPITPATATATKGWLLGIQYNSTPPTFTNGQQGSLQCDALGALSVNAVGKQASGQNIASNNPVMIGCRATTADLLVTNAQTAYATATLNGKLVVYPWAIPELTWNYAGATGGISNTTTAVTMKAAGAAGVRNYLRIIDLSSDTLGSATEIAVRDGAAGTVLWRQKLQTTALPQARFEFDPPLRGTAATLMEVVTLTATVTGGVYVNATGFQAA